MCISICYFPSSLLQTFLLNLHNNLMSRALLGCPHTSDRGKAQEEGHICESLQLRSGGAEAKSKRADPGACPPTCACLLRSPSQPPPDPTPSTASPGSSIRVEGVAMSTHVAFDHFSSTLRPSLTSQVCSLKLDGGSVTRGVRLLSVRWLSLCQRLAFNF